MLLRTGTAAGHTGCFNPYHEVVSTNPRTISVDAGGLGGAGRVVAVCFVMGVGDGSTPTLDGSLVEGQGLCEFNCMLVCELRAGLRAWLGAQEVTWWQ